MSTLNFFPLEMAASTIGAFTRQRTRETSTSHNFLVSCWNSTGAAGAKQTNKQTHNCLINHFLSCAYTPSPRPPLSVLCLVRTAFPQEACMKGDKISEDPVDYDPVWMVASLPFLISPSLPSSCPLSLPNRIPPLLPEPILPKFDPVCAVHSVTWVSQKRCIAS